jgi:type I restriction enzyme S subunit
MERYSSYKDSGVQWIGEIPEHWSLRRIKYIFSELKEKSENGLELPLSLSKDGGIIPFNEKKNKTMESASYVGGKIVHKGEIVFNRFKARLFAVSGYDGIVSSDYAVYKCNRSASPEYLIKLFGIDMYRDAFNRKASGIGDGFSRLYTDDLFAMFSIFPPLAEQEKIVSYLEDKTSKIDAYVADKEKEIELLQELKQKTIADAVTKGLNPDAKMKDSGISWIGDIPEHWEVCRMKRVFSEAKEKTISEEGTLLSLSQYTGITLKDDAKKVGMFEAESTIGYNVVHPGQFVMNIMLAWNGSYAVSDYEGIISPSYCVFNFNEDCEKKYFHYLLRLPAYAGAFKTMSKGIIESRLRLYPIYFLAFKTIIPPQNEQQAIVAYIEEKCEKIDKLASELQSEIDYLKEYKQRLIADCVTGQVNVQNEI